MWLLISVISNLDTSELMMLYWKLYIILASRTLPH